MKTKVTIDNNAKLRCLELAERIEKDLKEKPDPKAPFDMRSLRVKNNPTSVAIIFKTGNGYSVNAILTCQNPYEFLLEIEIPDAEPLRVTFSEKIELLARRSLLK